LSIHGFCHGLAAEITDSLREEPSRMEKITQHETTNQQVQGSGFESVVAKVAGAHRQLLEVGEHAHVFFANRFQIKTNGV
jgi:hypothetical protein